MCSNRFRIRFQQIFIQCVNDALLNCCHCIWNLTMPMYIKSSLLLLCGTRKDTLITWRDNEKDDQLQSSSAHTDTHTNTWIGYFGANLEHTRQILILSTQTHTYVKHIVFSCEPPSTGHKIASNYIHVFLCAHKHIWSIPFVLFLFASPIVYLFVSPSILHFFLFQSASVFVSTLERRWSFFLHYFYAELPTITHKNRIKRAKRPNKMYVKLLRDRAEQKCAHRENQSKFFLRKLNSIETFISAVRSFLSRAIFFFSSRHHSFYAFWQRLHLLRSFFPGHFFLFCLLLAISQPNSRRLVTFGILIANKWPSPVSKCST